MNATNIVLGVLSFFSLLLYTQNVLIQVNHEHITLGVDHLEITCRPLNSERLDVVDVFQIDRNGSSIATATYSRATMSTLITIMETTNIRFRGEVTGNVHASRVSDKFIKMLIPANNTMCEDEGNYTCSLTGQWKNKTTYTDKKHAYVEVRSVPNYMEDIYTPPTNDNALDGASGRFPVGSTFRFTCTGSVGKPAGSLRWCIKRNFDDDFSMLNPELSDVTETMPVIFQGCNFLRKLYLNFTMTLLDSKTDILCEPSDFTYFCGANPLNRTFVIQAIDFGYQHDTNRLSKTVISLVLIITLLLIQSVLVHNYD